MKARPSRQRGAICPHCGSPFVKRVPLITPVGVIVTYDHDGYICAPDDGPPLDDLDLTLFEGEALAVGEYDADA